MTIPSQKLLNFSLNYGGPFKYGFWETVKRQSNDAILTLKMKTGNTRF
jgi:hypothetical protein